jgi:hypothetical protein
MIVLAIGDQHRPFEHPDYLDFIKDTKKRFKATTLVNLGDEWDQAALSRYDSDPDGMSAGDERAAAIEASQKWYKAFPNMTVLESNHGVRPFKRAFRAGIPTAYLKPYRDFTCAPSGWQWTKRLVLDRVLYFHGDPFSGKDGAINAATKNRCSAVIGHIHTHGGVQYHRAFRDEIFGLNVGCGIDDTTYPFRYAQDNATRPTLGCGVIIDGREAFFVPMK